MNLVVLVILIIEKQLQPAIAAMHGPHGLVRFDDWVRFGNKACFGPFSVNILPSWLRNADQWKPDYRVVTNEKPRNYEVFGADQ